MGRLGKLGAIFVLLNFMQSSLNDRLNSELRLGLTLHAEILQQWRHCLLLQTYTRRLLNPRHGRFSTRNGR